MKTAAVSLNTTVRQMTEMSQWPKCLSKKMTEMTQRKKNSFAGSSRWARVLRETH